jgi:hypothetical protein
VGSNKETSQVRDRRVDLAPLRFDDIEEFLRRPYVLGRLGVRADVIGYTR